jgi:hypothetical protein
MHVSATSLLVRRLSMAASKLRAKIEQTDNAIRFACSNYTWEWTRGRVKVPER